MGRRIPETWKDEDEKEEDKREGHYSRETVLKKIESTLKFDMLALLVSRPIPLFLVFKINMY